jgi:hypothetical protein
MSNCETNYTKVGDDNGYYQNISAVLTKGNIMQANQHIDGSQNSATKISANVMNTLILGSIVQNTTNDIFCDANFNQAPTTKTNYQGDIDIRRQDVKYVSSTGPSFVIEAPELKIKNLPLQSSTYVLGYDAVTNQISYKAGSGGSTGGTGGGEPLNVTLGLGNTTDGIPINWNIGDIDLQKAGISIIKTNETYTPPAPIPPQPPLPVVELNRPIICKGTTGPIAMGLQNDNGIVNYNLQPDGSCLTIATKNISFLATDIASRGASLNLGYESAGQCGLSINDYGALQRGMQYEQSLTGSFIKNVVYDNINNISSVCEQNLEFKYVREGIYDNANNLSSQLDQDLTNKFTKFRISDNSSNAYAEIQADLNNLSSSISCGNGGINGIVQCFRDRTNIQGDNRVLGSFINANTETLLEVAGYGADAKIRLFANDNSSNAEIKYNALPQTLECVTNNFKIENTGDIEMNLNNVQSTYAVLYDDVTKKLSYGTVSGGTGGTGSAQSLNEVLTVGNTTTQAINWTNEIEIQRQGVQALTSGSITGIVASNVLDAKLPVKLGTSNSTIVQGSATNITPGTKVYVQNYVDSGPIGQLYCGNLNGSMTYEASSPAGTLFGCKLDMNPSNGEVLLRSNNNVSSQNNELKLTSTGASIKVLPNQSESNVLYYNTSTKAISYGAAGGGTGGSQNLTQVLATGNETGNNDIDFTSSAGLRILKNGNMIIESNPADQFKLHPNDIRLINIPSLTTPNILYIDNSTGKLSYGAISSSSVPLNDVIQTDNSISGPIKNINWAATNDFELTENFNPFMKSENLTFNPYIGYNNVTLLNNYNLCIHNTNQDSVITLGNKFFPTENLNIGYNASSKLSRINHLNGDLIVQGISSNNPDHQSLIEMYPTMRWCRMKAFDNALNEATEVYLDNANFQAFLSVKNQTNYLMVEQTKTNIKVIRNDTGNENADNIMYWQSSGNGEVTYKKQRKGQIFLNGTTGAVIVDANVSNSSQIYVQHNNGASGLMTNQGFLSIGNIIANTSFTVFSSNALDVNSCTYMII